MNVPLPDLELRTSAASYKLIGGILGPVIVLCASVAIAKEPELWWFAIAIGLMLAFAMIIFRSTKLALTDELLDYRCLFVRKTVPLVDIVKAKFLLGFSGYKPFMRIEVKTRGGNGEKEIIINVAWFETSQIRKLIQILDAKLAAMPLQSKNSGHQ